jgi:hypothetical protein
MTQINETSRIINSKNNLKKVEAAAKLFEELRDTGVVRWTDKTKAGVGKSEDGKAVSLHYNANSHCDHSVIEIKALDYTNSLQITSRFCFKEEIGAVNGDLEEIVQRAIVRSNEEYEKITGFIPINQLIREREEQK